MYPSQMPPRSMIKCSPVAVSSGVLHPVSPKTKAKALVRLGLLKPVSWLINTERGGWLRLFLGTGGLAWLVGISLSGATLTFLNTLPVTVGSISLFSLTVQAAKDTYHITSSFLRKKLDEEIARVQAEERNEVYVSDEEFDDLGYWGK